MHVADPFAATAITALVSEPADVSPRQEMPVKPVGSALNVADVTVPPESLSHATVTPPPVTGPVSIPSPRVCTQV